MGMKKYAIWIFFISLCFVLCACDKAQTEHYVNNHNYESNDDLLDNDQEYYCDDDDSNTENVPVLDQIEPEPPPNKSFSIDDIFAVQKEMGIKLGMTTSEIIDIFGEPLRIETTFLDAFEDFEYNYFYGHFDLYFQPSSHETGVYQLYNITIIDGSFCGPRSTKVGDYWQDITEKYALDTNPINIRSDYDEKYLYLETGTVGSFNKSGRIFYDESGGVNCISYHYPIQGTALCEQDEYLNKVGFEGFYLNYIVDDNGYIEKVEIGLLYNV